jgi:Methyltransferase FkbM domain
MKIIKKLTREALTRVRPSLVDSIVRLRAARAARRAEASYWKPRIADVVSCPDNARLPRHPLAGRVSNGFQIMHNGLRVLQGGYYGSGVTEMLRRNKGCHEPQEEIVFASVLPRLRTGACMVECGAYWGFYSLWFARDVAQARVWLIEPDEANLEIGKQNFAANALTGIFTRGVVGRKSRQTDPPQYSIDDFMQAQHLENIDLLHADIQGAELDMIHGASQALSDGKIDFLFISTHGDDLHMDCICALRTYGYRIHVSLLPGESYSFDGLIVANRTGLPNGSLPTPSRKSIRTTSSSD